MQHDVSQSSGPDVNSKLQVNSIALTCYHVLQHHDRINLAAVSLLVYRIKNAIADGPRTSVSFSALNKVIHIQNNEAN